MPVPLLASLALLVLAVPSALSAQDTPAPATAAPSGPSVSLKQMSVDVGAADSPERSRTIAAFGKAAGGIRTCDEVDAVAEKIGAKVDTNASVPVSSMPERLRVTIAKLPVGTATPLFGDPKEGVVRTIVLCGRNAG